jgi:hypothetical protein
MAWSRLAKKFREEEQQTSPQPASVDKKVSKAQLKKLAAKIGAGSSAPAPPAPPPPAPVVEPPPAPVVDAGPPKPGKRTREAVKRPRFVYVPPPKTERKEPAATPALPTPKGTTLAAKMMTKNLALPPEEDTPPALPGQFRP